MILARRKNMIHEQIAQIAEMIDTLTDPVREVEEKVVLHDEMLVSHAETLALHTEQIEQLLNPPLPPPPPPPPPRQGIIFDACFNQGDGSELYGFYWHQNPPVIVASGSNGPASREGPYMADCYLHRENSEHSYRTMGLYNRFDDAEPDIRERWTYDFNKSYWMAISMFLHEDWVADPLSNVLWQCQHTPDAQEMYKQPVLSVGVKGDQWRMFCRWDTREFTPPEEGSHWPNSVILYEAGIAPDLGKWTDWVFHVVWSWQDNGLVEVWKNGNQAAKRNGPNCANDARGPNSSFGVYEWAWRKEYWSKYTYKAIERKVWFDSIRIGDHTASYAAVAP